MSSKKYAAPLHLEVSSSRIFLILLFSLHLLSLILLFFMPVPLFFLVVCIALILFSAIYTIMYHANKALPRSIVGLIWDVEDEWFILQKNGRKLYVDLDGDSFINPLFSILNFKQKGHFFSRSVILLADNIDQNDFRRLRVRLKVTNAKKFEITE